MEKRPNPNLDESRLCNKLSEDNVDSDRERRPSINWINYDSICLEETNSLDILG